ncbi:protein OXIDATIVE STRESS 3 LIKE 4-like [Arachis stenosperma]|uniref:protein OXIDATIVE STRESS 3 LIKE 4-like n=1 Tax=Arachis stenosperma TaxID=217475 RepID=UPI0025AD1706|nr:protein OXIDATIVE STRESS 3 LIKE 4-like [Arachis stenosperma]
MEVLVGPTFAIDVSSSPPPPVTAATADQDRLGSAFRISAQPKFFAGDLSESSSSSIGTPDDDSGDEEEIQSGLKPGLGSLDSLEDSLPIKRGLSSHFDGKSKSFTDLSQVNNLMELQKQESPFNKRRRVLIASKWRKSSFYTWSKSNPTSMPLLPVNEDHDDDVDDDDDDDDDFQERKARKVPSTSSSSSSSSLSEEKKHEDQVQVQVQVQVRHTRIVPESYAAHMRLRLGSFKTRSFSLADLQEHADEEDHDD